MSQLFFLDTYVLRIMKHIYEIIYFEWETLWFKN